MREYFVVEYIWLWKSDFKMGDKGGKLVSAYEVKNFFYRRCYDSWNKGRSESAKALIRKAYTFIGNKALHSYLSFGFRICYSSSLKLGGKDDFLGIIFNDFF